LNKIIKFLLTKKWLRPAIEVGILSKMQFTLGRVDFLICCQSGWKKWFKKKNVFLKFYFQIIVC